MQFYDCKVRLGGNVMHEVRKENITAPEIMVLRALHGDDAVVEIVVKKFDKFAGNAKVRQQLYKTYADPETNNSEVVAKRMEMMRGLFGHDAVKLPETLPEEAPGATADEDAKGDFTE